jgi:hypothetical protein
LISDKHSRNEIHTSRPGRLNKSRDYVVDTKEMAETHLTWCKDITTGTT